MSGVDLEKRKKTNKKILKFFGFVLLIFSALSIFAALVGGKDAEAIKTPNALPYKIITKHNIRKGVGDGVYALITFADINLPKDIGKLTTQNLGDTIIKAAKDLAHGEKIVIAEIHTDGGNKYADMLANAVYTPDSGGIGGNEDQIWLVRASTNIPTYQQVLINKIWWENRDQFQKDGMTDEPAIKKFIAKRLGITVDQVTLPFTSPAVYFKSNALCKSYLQPLDKAV